MLKERMNRKYSPQELVVEVVVDDRQDASIP